MGNERRRSPRVTADIPFRFVGEEGTEEPFALMDLSESGARIRCSRRLPAMTRMRVGLVLPGGALGRTQDVRLEATGVVVWCHLGQDGLFDTGMFFSDLADDDRSLLRSFVRAAT